MAFGEGFYCEFEESGRSDAKFFTPVSAPDSVIILINTAKRRDCL